MNKCIFLGNITKDFEVAQSQGGINVARSAIALNRGKDSSGNDRGADFVNIVAFGKTAEFFEKYGRKGRKFLLETHVQTGSYEKDGQRHYTTDFVVDRAEFADSKPEATNTGNTEPDNDGWATEDGDLPFAMPTR